MPVLPDDGSMIVWPGVSVPSASASSIIARAMRSFTEPAGFCPSSLAEDADLRVRAELAHVDDRRVADQVDDRLVDRHGRSPEKLTRTLGILPADDLDDLLADLAVRRSGTSAAPAPRPATTRSRSASPPAGGCRPCRRRWATGRRRCGCASASRPPRRAPAGRTPPRRRRTRRARSSRCGSTRRRCGRARTPRPSPGRTGRP